MKEIWFATRTFIGSNGDITIIPIKENNKIRMFKSESDLRRYLTVNTGSSGIIYQIHKGYINI